MGLDQNLFRRTKDGDFDEIYWRKANFVHRYFTENWDERGFESDNVTEFPITRKDLERLLELCEEVLEDKNQAPYLLPTMSGFFFGSVEYDTWYFDDVQETRDKIEALLKEATDEDEFIYYAWY